MKYLLIFLFIAIVTGFEPIGATECSAEGCNSNPNNSALNQGQETNNMVNMSPTMALGSSNSNVIMNSDTVAGSGVALSADGGINISGNCPTDSLITSVTMGGNNISTKPSYYESDSKNIQLTIGYSHTFGEGRRNCEEGQRVSLQAAKWEVSKKRVNGCIDIAKLGVSLTSIVAIAPQFKVCSKVFEDAQRGYHGEIARRAIEQYKQKVLSQTSRPVTELNEVFAK